jgi:hypothetical protein
MMMAFCPLDAMMGHPRLDRAVTNHVRSMRLLAEAKVTSYSINQPIKIEEFH